MLGLHKECYVQDSICYVYVCACACACCSVVYYLNIWIV